MNEDIEIDSNYTSSSGVRLSDEFNDPIVMPPRPKALAERFEEMRQDNLRLGFPILTGNAVHQRHTVLDQVPPDELPEAADSILLAHAARMVIRAVAKVENAWAKYDGNHDSAAIKPYCETIDALIKERDKATAYYQKLRERQARVDHLESICERGKTLEFPKPRLPRAKFKKMKIG